MCGRPANARGSPSHARFLDEVNEQELLAEGSTQGKYDVNRALGTYNDIRLRPDRVRLLDAA